MVFFVCDACGETIKKSQVDKHANFTCRGRCDSVSCVDCSISFFGDDYRSHTTCLVTERDNLVVPNNTKNGKASPQDIWMDLIRSSIITAPPDIKSSLQQLVQVDNVPRKEKQFRNFTANSLNLKGSSGQKQVDSIWKYLMDNRQKQKDHQQQQKEKATNNNNKKEEKEKDNIKNEQSLSLEHQNSKSSPHENESDKSNSSDDNDETAKNVEKEKKKKKKKEKENVVNGDDGSQHGKYYKKVCKATKKILKHKVGKSMELKLLRKTIRDQLKNDEGIDISKKMLKKMICQVIEEKPIKIVLNGQDAMLVK